MKKGYWVVVYRSILDESALTAYGELALPAVEAFGGRFLTRSTSQVQPHEAGQTLRAVLVEFESYDKALAAHESEAYQKGASGSRFRRFTRFPHRGRGINGGQEGFSLSNGMSRFLNRLR